MAAAEKFRDKPPAGPGDLPSTVAQPIQEESEEEEEVKMSCQKQPSNRCKTIRESKFLYTETIKLYCFLVQQKMVHRDNKVVLFFLFSRKWCVWEIVKLGLMAGIHCLLYCMAHHLPCLLRTVSKNHHDHQLQIRTKVAIWDCSVLQF